MDLIAWNVHIPAMTSDDALGDLVQHLCQTRGLEEPEATRILQEVLNYFSEGRDEFVRRRHRELQGSGLPNATIYRRLARELAQHRFPSGPVTEGQIRRMI